LSEDDHSTAEGGPQDLVASARLLRDKPELGRRFMTFLFLEERLRRPEPRPAVTAIIAAAYNDPAVYWQNMVDLDPERISVTRERFVAVHAATRYGEIRRLGRILAMAAVQAILGDDGKPWRERLRMLMTDPDYGYLIGPDLCGYLTGDVTPKPGRSQRRSKPPLVKDLDAQIAAFEREHPDWGQARLHREWHADGTRPRVARSRFRKLLGGRPPRD
jgi:hypothetical protein